ncbi:MAG TPA: GNAT family N-acetyltransferase, partial [Fimbriimonas sp.]|nr:GNAT family N-acetyltransferase [Fimbriimonas sp.]
ICLKCGLLREVSGVCTHPDYLGRGYAARLSNRVLRLQLLRGETPFLHVISDNEGARHLYRKLGFVDDLESVVRLIELVR